MPQDEAATAAKPSGAVNGAGAIMSATVSLFGRALREQWLFIVLVGFYLAVAYVVARAFGQPLSVGLYRRLHLIIFVNFGVLCLTYRIVRLIARERPEHPLRRVWADWTSEFALGQRLVRALPIFLLLPPASSAVTSIKKTIPETLGFAWDETFAQWDAWLHGGVQPWVLLQPLLGRPWITEFIDDLYGVPWFVLLLAIEFWLVFSRDPRRLRLLMTFLLSWILLGNLAATLFGSAGPAYYGRLVEGSNPFAPLMVYLHTVSGSDGLFAIRAQGHLWENYQSGFLLPGTGISAMPSMHVAIACFVVIMAWPWHWSLRWLALGYLVVVQIGSVHLGWHYAIDGYVGIAGTFLIWKLAGRLAPDRPQGFGSVSAAPMRP